MRKIAIVGALAALAWAQGVRAEDPAKAEAEAQEKVQKAEAKAHEKTAEAQADAQKKTAEAQKDVRKEKAEAQEKVQDARRDEMRQGTAAGTGTGSMAARDERKHPMFEGKDNYEVKGKIEAVTASSITVRRDELPAAKLSVDHNTKIELDGQHVAASQLKQGQDVKASFNLKDDKPLAVEIKAEKMK
ncbi:MULTISPECIES: DUF5666 domain-containing protein [Anaeromyxobacter]|uniref:DUF5666 domain-containing protein n=1 Tax=Anaeromyxobacter TaxID=161492 RepID=UPI001F57E4C6|nr:MULTISPECIES: DUF5666 domain-containing protein [unclassified Anaeromyxobacter]